MQSPTNTAELLLSNVLGADRTDLYRMREGLTTAQAKLFGRALCRRCSGTPVQHITGEAGFRRLVLRVEPGVFVPRPETEILVEVALGSIGGTEVVVDVGTGTGAVALAIKDERPQSRIFATDISSEAVLLARDNAVRLKLDIEVFQGALFAPLPLQLRGAVDVVVSNPPYVAPESAGSLPSEVLADPPSALFGGIAMYRDLFGAAFDWLRPGGVVVVEIDEDRSLQVLEEAEAAGFVATEVHLDLSGRERVVRAGKPGGVAE